MKKRSSITIQADSQGRVMLPAALVKRYGLTPGAKVLLEEGPTGFRVSRSSDNLAHVYIEPTNQCNLECVTCMRNAWDEAPGSMSESTFDRILQGIAAFEPVPQVFFGGFGEPLTHPRICDMVARARHAGAQVELITNGILLDGSTAERLIDAGLQRVWVSLDGATPESYADVRLGAALPEVLGNLRSLQALRGIMNSSTPRLGIAFVAMKRNIADLPELVRIGKSLGADQFSISNVLPHTAALRDEMLFQRSSHIGELAPSEWSPLIALLRIDINALTAESLAAVLQLQHLLSIIRQNVSSGANTCPFIEKASLSIRWDGSVSPCLALLHTHESYLGNRARRSHAYSTGSLSCQTLSEIWNDPAYRALRERLLEFDFSPCAFCNSCEMAEQNLEDCFGNVLPACGGCLWAQGFIQCP
jgi:MoaA/NifB/PqqE/SkfB family radical SAM enzyme